MFGRLGCGSGVCLLSRKVDILRLSPQLLERNFNGSEELGIFNTIDRVLTVYGNSRLDYSRLDRDGTGGSRD